MAAGASVKIQTEIQQSLNYLERNGIAEYDQQGALIAFREDSILDERGKGELERSGVDSHRQYAQNFMDFIDFFNPLQCLTPDLLKLRAKIL
ncbi:MAG: hypothetical protein V4654_08960 [Bdellovibrionota bacterium]